MGDIDKGQGQGGNPGEDDKPDFDKQQQQQDGGKPDQQDQGDAGEKPQQQQ